MTYDNLRIALRSFAVRAGFRPYWVRLTGGEVLEVRHPEALVMRGQIAVFVAPGNAHTLFDCDSVSSISQKRIGGEVP